MDRSGNTIVLVREDYPRELERIEEVVEQPMQEFLNAQVETARQNCGRAACGLYARCKSDTTSHWEPHQMAGGPDHLVEDPISKVSVSCNNQGQGCAAVKKEFSEHIFSIFETCLEAMKSTEEATEKIRARSKAAVQKLEEKKRKDIEKKKKEILSATRSKIGSA